MASVENGAGSVGGNDDCALREFKLRGSVSEVKAKDVPTNRHFITQSTTHSVHDSRTCVQLRPTFTGAASPWANE